MTRTGCRMAVDGVVFWPLALVAFSNLLQPTVQAAPFHPSPIENIPKYSDDIVQPRSPEAVDDFLGFLGDRQLLAEDDSYHDDEGDDAEEAEVHVLPSLIDLQQRFRRYKYALPWPVLRRAMSQTGSMLRLRRAMLKMLRQENGTITLAGGSITLGQGALHVPSSYTNRLSRWVNETFPGSRVVNTARGGSTAAIYSACAEWLIPEESDIIILEFTMNEAEATYLNPNTENNRWYERLLRKLLDRPNRPAVILLHAYSFVRTKGRFDASAESGLSTMASYYDLPSISVRAALWNLMYNDAPGFKARIPIRGNEEQVNASQTYLYDDVHPASKTGHRYMAEMLFWLLQFAARDVLLHPAGRAEGRAVHAPLPPPLIENNHHTPHGRCRLGPLLQESVLPPHSGWEWKNDGSSSNPKWGFVSTVPGSQLELQVNTSSNAFYSSGAHPQHANTTTVFLGLLSSYNNTGTVQVDCLEPCRCLQGAGKISCGWSKKVSLLQLQELVVTQHDSCRIRLTVLQETVTNGHKIRLSSVVVMEEAGTKGGMSGMSQWATLAFGSAALNRRFSPT